MRRIRVFLWILFFPAVVCRAEDLRDFLPMQAKIFDVGSNIGDKTLYYLSLGAERVVCIEPHPQVVTVLKNRYVKDSRVVVEALGLSDKEGVVSFFPAKSSVISTMSNDWKLGRFKREQWESEIQVPVTTLDSMIEKYGIPDFCKIDVEGYELNVLMGLTHRIPHLSFEFAYEFLDKKTKPCLDRLVELGFEKFNVAFGEDGRFVFEEWMDAESLFSYLKNLQDKLSWGDIYAR